MTIPEKVSPHPAIGTPVPKQPARRCHTYIALFASVNELDRLPAIDLKSSALDNSHMSKSTHFKSFLLVFAVFSLVACAGPKKDVKVTPEATEEVDEVARNRAALATEKGWDIRKFDLNRDNQADIFKFYGKSGDGEAMTS